MSELTNEELKSTAPLEELWAKSPQIVNSLMEVYEAFDLGLKKDGIIYQNNVRNFKRLLRDLPGAIASDRALSAKIQYVISTYQEHDRSDTEIVDLAEIADEVSESEIFVRKVLIDAQLIS